MTSIAFLDSHPLFNEFWAAVFFPFVLFILAMALLYISKNKPDDKKFRNWGIALFLLLAIFIFYFEFIH